MTAVSHLIHTDPHAFQQAAQAIQNAPVTAHDALATLKAFGQGVAEFTQQNMPLKHDVFEAINTNIAQEVKKMSADDIKQVASGVEGAGALAIVGAAWHTASVGARDITGVIKDRAIRNFKRVVGEQPASHFKLKDIKTMKV